MKIFSLNDLYFYKELFGDDFILHKNELIKELKQKEINLNNTSKDIKSEILENNPSNKEITKNISENPPIVHILKNREGIRDTFIEYYKTVLKTNHCPLYRSGRPFIFGAGNLNQLDLMILYSEASEHDEQNPKKPMTDQNGRYILSLLMKAGINLKNSFIAPIIKCHPNKTYRELTSIVKDINIKITLNQIEIAHPPLVVIFGLDLGLHLLKSTKNKVDLKRKSDEFLHNLRNRLITRENGYKAIVTYDYNELIHDKTKLNEFISKDLPFIVENYKEYL